MLRVCAVYFVFDSSVVVGVVIASVWLVVLFFVCLQLIACWCGSLVCEWLLLIWL